MADDEEKDLEHGKVCDDMWALDLHKFTVRDPDMFTQQLPWVPSQAHGQYCFDLKPWVMM